MVQYVYQKYNSQFNSGYYYASQTGSNNYPSGSSYSFSGYTGYSIDGSGNFIGSGSTSYSWPTNGSSYSGGGSSFSHRSTGGGTTTVTDYSIYYASSYYSQGSYIEQLVAEDGTYPSNGRHTDGFYYVRGVIATPPVLISPDGGEIFNTVETITWTIPRTGLKYKVELTKNNGTTWSTLLLESTIDATSYTKDFTNESESGLAKIRITGIDGTYFTASDESSGVFSIIHNVAPTAPTSLIPSSTIVDRTKTNRFSWSHNDSANDNQSKADLRWRVVGSSTWNNITSNGLDQEYFFALNTLPNGQIEWQVRTYDSGGLISPWSNIAVFTSGEPTNSPVITSPISTVSISRPVIQWVSSSQASYQIVVENSLNVVIWDSGEITSIVKSSTVGADLINGETYKVKLRVKEASGLFSSFVEKTFVVSYTPPARPSLQVYSNKSHVRLVISHPMPKGSQPTVNGVDIYKKIKDEWIRIANNVGDTFSDYAVASKEKAYYKILAKGSNGTFSESAIVEVVASTLNGVWLLDVNDPESTIHQFKFDGGGRDDNYQTEHAYRQFAGRERSTIEYGTFAEYSVSISLDLLKRDLDRDSIINFVRNHSTLLYRDGRGRKFYTSLPSLSMNEESYGNSVTIRLQEIDYEEEV